MSVFAAGRERHRRFPWLIAAGLLRTRLISFALVGTSLLGTSLLWIALVVVPGGGGFVPAAHAEVLASQSSAEIRIGIQIFRRRRLPLVEYDRLLGSLPPLLGGRSIKLAVGSQQDMLTWAANSSIDAAIVPPLTLTLMAAHSTANHEPSWSALAIDRMDGQPSAVPASLVVASPRLAGREELAAAFALVAPGRFDVQPGWIHGDWQQAVGAFRPDRLQSEALDAIATRDRMSLDDFSGLLTLHACSQPQPLRLAVVFAGGGAKCSYQVGAVRALEETLASLRESRNDPSYDIALAAGTSGGALNALPVALGISADAAGQGDFAAVWQELDQRELIRPSTPIRALMVLWFVCLQGALLLRLRRARHFKDPEAAPWIISPLFVILGAAQIIVARLPYKPWTLIGMSSSLHHFWLWLSWGLEGSGWTLIGLAAASQIVRRIPLVAHTSFPLRYRAVRRMFIAGIFLIPIIQTINIFLCQSTLSDNVGIEAAIVRNFRALIDRELVRSSQPPLAAAGQGDRHAAMEAMGREILDRRLLKRDLVLTGSELPKATSEAPGDLYFYARGNTASGQPKFGARGVDLDEHRSLFMDVLMGSGAIYPVFPARTLQDFPAPGQTIELVDGSFEHRSPVEAAVLWGATHILVIQAAVDEVSPRGSFLDNVMAAVNHLYDQAQLLDFRSREHAVTVTLTPAPPHIGLLDFSDNLIRWAIDKGYREARFGLPGSGSPDGQYRKEVSEPLFWVPPMLRRARPECQSLAL